MRLTGAPGRAPGSARAAAVGLALGATGVAAAVGPVPAVTAATLVWCLVRARRRARENRRRAAVRQAAEDLLTAFAAELDTGAAPADALRVAAGDLGVLPRPTGRPSAWSTLDTLRSELARAEQPARLLLRSEAAALRQLGIAYQVCDLAGARLAPIASMLAAVARADAVRAGELTAALAGPRSSGRLVAALPVAGLVLGSLAGADPVPVLTGTRAGIGCLLVGVCTDLVGLYWLRRVAERVEARVGPVAMDASRPAASPAAARDRLLADFPLALDLVAACLRGGGTTAAALEAVGRSTGGTLGTELRTAAADLADGTAMESACARLIRASHVPGLVERMRERLGRPVPEMPTGTGGDPPGAGHAARWPRMVRAAVTALERSESSGARLSTTLTQLADRARDENHADSIAAARRAGVLAVAPLGLCFLPAFLLLGVVPVVLGTAPTLVPA